LQTEGDLSKENVELREENSELKQSVSDWQSKYSEVEGSSRQHQQVILCGLVALIIIVQQTQLVRWLDSY